VIDTFFVCSNEEDKNIWHFSIVMLQWWEKEATQNKNNIKNNNVQMKCHFWKQLSNEGYYGAVINKTKTKF